jgi:hypothetical protein
LYAVNGKLVETLLNQPLARGNYNVTFDASNLRSGTYFYSLSINQLKPVVQKMVLIR